MYEDEIDIVICIVPSDGCVAYNEIKYVAELEIGILTQCIKSNTFSNNIDFRETFLLNINAKLNGINLKLQTAPIIKDFDTTPVMLIGAYVAPSELGQRNAPRYGNTNKQIYVN